LLILFLTGYFLRFSYWFFETSFIGCRSVFCDCSSYRMSTSLSSRALWMCHGILFIRVSLL
jgi:hypothetical protein